MSRTIRRKNNSGAVWYPQYYRIKLNHGSEKELQSFAKWLGVSRDKDLYECFMKKKFHSDCWMTMSTPGWWNKIHNTIKIRVDNRHKIRKVLHLNDLEDTPLFHERLKVPYYW